MQAFIVGGADLLSFPAGEKKPVVASMGDVAASGGYYMGMACKTIVAEPLTITGKHLAWLEAHAPPSPPYGRCG